MNGVKRRLPASLAALTMAMSALPAFAQTAAELRAQLEETRSQIRQAEAAGVDESLLGPLREMLADVERMIAEDAAAAAATPASSSEPSTSGYAYPPKPNWLANEAACQGFTLENYRTYALSGGPDTQLKTLCGGAYEYYAMYLRAIRQGYSPADSDRTYAAYEGAARTAVSFYAGAR